jgi:hypothetical protein
VSLRDGRGGEGAGLGFAGDKAGVLAAVEAEDLGEAEAGVGAGVFDQKAGVGEGAAGDVGVHDVDEVAEEGGGGGVRAVFLEVVDLAGPAVSGRLSGLELGGVGAKVCEIR